MSSTPAGAPARARPEAGARESLGREASGESGVSPIPYAMHEVSSADWRAVGEVLRSDRLTQGPRSLCFEKALTEVTGASEVVSVSSGTAALQVALAALGIGAGDEVIVPSLTFLATANAVLLCGATPVFADIDPRTLNLSADSVALRLTPRTRAAIAVHYAGHPADTDAIAFALGPDRFLVEDACHALGARKDGRFVGSLGDAACFSFHPAKHVTTGEGGAVATNHPEVALRARMHREHGVERRADHFQGLGLPASWAAEQQGPWVYEMHALAPNYRLPELSAALGLSQLTRLDDILDRRRAIAKAYSDAFASNDAVELPAEDPGVRSAWHLYPLRLRLEALRVGRAELFRRLRARGLGVQVHYIPVHLQPYYRKHLGTGFGDLRVTESEYMRLISIPLFPSLSQRDLQRVIEIVHDELRRARR